MTKLLTAIALAATLLTTAAHAGDLPDYSDKTAYTCDKDGIKERVTTLWDNGPAAKEGIKLLYVKGEPVEIARKSDELRCQVVLVTNVMSVQGTFWWRNQDGHTLIGFDAGKIVR